MRVSISGVFDDCDPASSTEPIESLLQPFLEQSVPIRAIVAVGCHLGSERIGREIQGILPVGPHPEAFLHCLGTQDGSPPVLTVQREGERALDSFARQARTFSESVSGHDLLLLPAPVLDQLMTPLDEDFRFRAVAVLSRANPGQLDDPSNWKMRRALFDRGLLCIASLPIAGGKALCFLASDAVQSVNRLHIEPRGLISMSAFLEHAAFANQLFRYACLKLYSLRHALTPALPAWVGNQLFGLQDRPCEDLNLPQLSYPAFAQNDREIWDKEEPPINIDLDGYFQEIPECWRRHRPLLRRLFHLSPEYTDALDAWRDEITGGRRTLVAIHVRRCDYRNLQNLPWFRLVPEEWYLDWLRTIWPTLSEPLLFVATDEPDTIVPVFQEFEPISVPSSSIARGLADPIRDFEMMRRADYLAICNSSFSRMAAILAPSAQKCFLPSFKMQRFTPYEPWIDPVFWARFADSRYTTHRRRSGLGQPGLMKNKDTFDASPEQATIFLDLSDLLLYLLHHTTLSGIQRVQCEILRNLLEIPHPQPVRFVVLDKCGGLGEVDVFALLDIIEDLRSDTTPRSQVEANLRALLNRVVPCTIRTGDIFLTLGAFWSIKGMGLLLQKLKNSGVIIGVFIHDIIPITASEYFEARETKVFVKAVSEALTFADFILTTSEYNKASLVKHLASRKLGPLGVHLVPLGDELMLSVQSELKVSSAVASVVDTEYVLCVGTIEVRKNPTYLFNIWKMMMQSGRLNIPYLVLAGRRGWLVQDFMDQLRACHYLGGKIIMLHNVTDAELDLLYRKCVVTMLPSFVEGWGLPVGESLARGKVCLCSATGGIPEVGGEFVEYIDPYNASNGLEQLLRYLDNPELRRTRERKIADHFQPRSWRKAAEDLLRSSQVLARQVPTFEGVVAMTLPPNQYLPISSDPAALVTDGMDGTLSAELICISGWHPPEISGARAAQPVAAVRFCADAAPGTKINLTLRLAAYGRDFNIRIRTASGAETEVSLLAGSERLAVLPCEVETGKLVTAHLFLLGAALDTDELSGSSYWMLKGILYFDPKRIAVKALDKLKGGTFGPSPAMSPPPMEQWNGPADALHQERILLRPAPSVDDSRRATSFGAFLQSTNSCWPSEFTTDRDAPMFADHTDKRAFYSGCGNSAQSPQVGRIKDCIKLVRRSDQFVSTSRFSEGSVFDRSGVWRGLGYLQGSPPAMMPCLSKEADGLWVTEESLATAPYYDQSYLIFYNGNLHNYYHWLVEGLLCLDILSRALGPDSNLKVALPKSVDINALFDHRGTLHTLGLDRYEVLEIEANLIKVRDAIWIDSDLVESMPAPYLKDFQQRIAALYAGLRSPRNRRLLIARKGPTRTIHNIEQVRAFLSRYDFETVYLEGMSMMDQILLFQSAEFIIAPHGAGLANLLFCEPGTKVIELMPSVEFRPFFWLISEKLDLVHGLQFCTTAAGQGFQDAINVDVGKLEALIRMINAHF